MDPITLAVAAIAITGAGVAIAIITFDKIKNWVKKKLNETVWFLWKKIRRIFVVRQELPAIKEQGIWNLLAKGEYSTMHHQCQIDALAVDGNGQIAARETFVGKPDEAMQRAFTAADFIAGKRVVCIENN